jgi:hypothetical protein
MTNTMVTVIAATNDWKIRSQPLGKPKITLSSIHTAEAASTPSAVRGRPAQRSIAHSRRLRFGLPSIAAASGGGGPVTTGELSSSACPLVCVIDLPV